jgi:hypothetical protein
MVETLKDEMPFSDIKNFPSRFHELEQAVQILKSYKAFGNALKDQGKYK